MNQDFLINASETTNNSKEEKLAAAKKRLQEFKKNKENVVKNGGLINNYENLKINKSIESISNDNDMIYNQNHNLIESNRSSPTSRTSYGMTKSQINDLEKHQNDYIDIITKNSARSIDLNTSRNEYLSENYYEQKYKNDMKVFQEQQQLHLQTIGILVAEKTELQSTLQQTIKKIDFKQEEIDELSGRLKASRQKINELEKYISQMNETNVNVEKINNQQEGTLNAIQVQLNSTVLANDELKIRLNEINEKFFEKVNENKQLLLDLNDLKGQLEINQLRVQQLSSGIIENNNNNNNNQSNEDTELINNLNVRIIELDRYSNELKNELESSYQQKIELQNEYQVYVEQLRKQIENLVDTINRMTDEREAAFQKIEYSEQLINQLKIENDKFIELNNKIQSENQAVLDEKQTKMLIDERKQQLECEVQYFKQQIEILLVENNHLNGLIVEKDGQLEQMKKMHFQISDEKQNYEKLLDAMQSEKTALSRAIQQNKELKDQLNELEEAYIKQTNINAEFLNKLQSEQHLNKQLSVSINLKDDEINDLKSKIENKLKNAINLIENSSNEIEDTNKLNQDWSDDDANSSKNNNNENVIVASSSNNISPNNFVNEETNREIERISRSYNELINTLNDKDLLISQLNNELNELKDKINAENYEKETLVSQLRTETEAKYKEEINSLNTKIQDLEFERNKLIEVNEKLNYINNTDNNNNKNDKDTNDDASQNGNNNDELSVNSQKHVKLLEYKITKVVQENIDLKEKNQQLEHIVTQLQFENESIVDYVSMYQVEREKLAQKYRMKDETIRKLNSQLQMNKFSIKELNECFNEYLNSFHNNINNNQNEDDNVETSKNDTKQENLINQINEIILKINETNKIENNQDNSNDSTINNNENKYNNHSINKLNDYNNKITPLKSIIICSACQGDLFTV